MRNFKIYNTIDEYEAFKKNKTKTIKKNLQAHWKGKRGYARMLNKMSISAECANSVQIYM